MIEFGFSLDALGQTRFAYSPLAEVATSLRLLSAPRPGDPVLLPWARRVHDLVSGMQLPTLRSVLPPGPEAPEFLFMRSTDPKVTLERQLEDVLDLPDETVARHLDAVWGHRERPAEARRLMDGGRAERQRLADQIWEYWQTAIAPDWSRMRAVIDDDVAYRGGQVLAGGLYELFAQLHPMVELKSGTLRVDKPPCPEPVCPDSTLTLVPCIFVWPKLMVSYNTAGEFDMFYAARGIGRIWETASSADAHDALGSLLGRSRAEILTRLAVPASTTQLARELGQSPASVSQHLSVMKGCGLLTSWRSGRSILYRRTALAGSLIAATEPDSPVVSAQG